MSFKSNGRYLQLGAYPLEQDAILGEKFQVRASVKRYMLNIDRKKSGNSVFLVVCKNDLFRQSYVGDMRGVQFILITELIPAECRITANLKTFWYTVTDSFLIWKITSTRKLHGMANLYEN